MKRTVIMTKLQQMRIKDPERRRLIQMSIVDVFPHINAFTVNMGRLKYLRRYFRRSK